ncbi:ribonuclease E activity regulator RraA [Anaerobacillus sp. MEB173]|uniref:ribonuclease E activity regulator RraA n=1 Tax=Anaerobacillus sp. MEB173 TaxID=3383345 RepID=UPI003F92C2CE
MPFNTADLCDEFTNQVKVAEPIFYSYGGKKKFSGPIATVKVYEDNVLVKKALETIPEGTVLVVDGGGSRKCALLGDNLAAIGQKRGLAGVIIYGCIRDSAEIAEMEIGVLAVGTNPFKSIKQGKGHENISIQFAGIDWVPGHFVYADEDGILISEQNLLK